MVIAILGVLAAVVVPNVGKFIGQGDTAAEDTELANVQLAMTALMVDNNVSLVVVQAAGSETNVMTADIDAVTAGTQSLSEYLISDTTAYWYSWTTAGKVSQVTTAP